MAGLRGPRWRLSLISALSALWALGWLVKLTLGSTEREEGVYGQKSRENQGSLHG